MILHFLTNPQSQNGKVTPYQQKLSRLRFCSKHFILFERLSVTRSCASMPLRTVVSRYHVRTQMTIEAVQPSDATNKKKRIHKNVIDMHVAEKASIQTRLFESVSTVPLFEMSLVNGA